MCRLGEFEYRLLSALPVVTYNPVMTFAKTIILTMPPPFGELKTHLDPWQRTIATLVCLDGGMKHNRLFSSYDAKPRQRL